MTEAAEGVRLQKVLANAGVASRRVCEDYIVAGRVRRIDQDADGVNLTWAPRGGGEAAAPADQAALTDAPRKDGSRSPEV